MVKISMLFAEPLSPSELSVRESPERRALVRSLLDDFGHTFPTIEFSLISEFRFLNAQALLLGSRRQVKLYGGLAFHNRLGKDALAFALLHEAGHHLAIGSRLNWNPSLACECVSDLWAVNEGAGALRQRTGYAVNIVKAIEELDKVIEQPTEPERSHTCWALSWFDRKTSILKKGPDKRREECPLGELMMRATNARHWGWRTTT
jgi:hypothetical protein